MTKKRKTVSVDPEVKAYLDSEGRNASETVNRLVKLDMGEEAVNGELIRMRMEMEKDRYETAAQKAKGHLTRYNQLRDRLEKRKQERNQERESLITEAAEQLKPDTWLKSLPKEEQIPPADSDDIQHYAEQCDMDAKQFRSRVINHILGEDDE